MSGAGVSHESEVTRRPIAESQVIETNAAGI